MAQQANVVPLREVDPRDVAALLDDAVAYLTNFVVFDDSCHADAVALWSLFTHSFYRVRQEYSSVPYLFVASAEIGSGKSKLLEVMRAIVHSPYEPGSATAALIGRSMKGHTLMLDEVDQTYNFKRTDDPAAAALLSLLNRGFQRGGSFDRLVLAKNGRDWQAVSFDTFGPKAMFGLRLGTLLSDALLSRGIRVQLVKKVRGESVERGRDRLIRAKADPLRERMQQMADGLGVLPFVDDVPDQLSDRDCDVWEPLFAIADKAGVEWGKRARKAALSMSRTDAVMSVGVQLLYDIRVVFDSIGKAPDTFIESRALIGVSENVYTGQHATGLMAFEQSPWATWPAKGGFGVHALANRLKEYGIRPIRFKGAMHRDDKGYFRSQFEPVWRRYLEDGDPEQLELT